MSNEKLNLRPLYELLAVEVDLDELINHLHNIHYYFSENSMKVSCLNSVPVDEQEVICQYWIERLKLAKKLKYKIYSINEFPNRNRTVIISTIPVLRFLVKAND